jgi:predicted CopG family antitoxin
VKTIRVSEEAHAALKRAGRKGETFSDIILRICKEEKR